MGTRCTDRYGRSIRGAEGDGMSQNKDILNHLIEKGTITPIEALNLYGCFRLGARIADLKKEGVAIRTDIVARDGKRFAQYSLEGVDA